MYRSLGWRDYSRAMIHFGVYGTSAWTGSISASSSNRGLVAISLLGWSRDVPYVSLIHSYFRSL